MQHEAFIQVVRLELLVTSASPLEKRVADLLPNSVLERIYFLLLERLFLLVLVHADWLCLKVGFWMIHLHYAGF